MAGKISEVGYFLSGSFLETDGAQAISKAEEKKFFGKLAYSLSDEVKATTSFGYNEADTKYALDTSATVVAQPYDTRYGSIRFDIDRFDHRWGMAFKYNDQNVTTDITSIATGTVLSSTISSNVYKGISLNGSVDLFDDDILVAGADFDWVQLKSNRFLDTSKSINMQAPYANYTATFGSLSLVPGVRYDHNEQFGEQVSPSFGIIYDFKDQRNTIVRGKASRAFNAPPLLWIFNDDPALFVGPNPDLEAERANVYEVGFETNLFPSLDLELSAYRSDIKDGIALVFDATKFVFVQTNFRKFRRQGGELVLNYRVNDDLSLYGSGAFNDVENRATGETVRDSGVARQRYTFGARYKNEHGWGAHLSGYYNRWSSAPSLQPNDRKPIFDLKLTKKFNSIDAEIFANIYNLTNSKYWSSISFPLAERHFEGGFAIDF